MDNEKTIYEVIADYANATPIEKAKLIVFCLGEVKSLHPLNTEALLEQADELILWLTKTVQK
jgi:hypothetical protein